jgi:ribokinase
MKPIVVVGSINMDLVSRTPWIPTPGQTVIGSDFQMHSGGKGANQAVAAARLGYPCILLGKVGTDVFGDTLLQGLRNNGVETEHIEKAEGPSGTASICVEDSGENCIVVIPGANSRVNVEYLERKLDVLQNAGIVLAQLEIPLEVVERLAEICNDIGIPFMLDPAPASELSPALLQNVDWFTPNETEASFYSRGEKRDEVMFAALLKYGMRGVILKRGSRGSLLGQRGALHRVPAFEVQVRDTTAAGDAFNGAFAVGLMRGLSPQDSARMASAAAALSVTRPGAQPSMANQQELDAFVSSVLSR